MGSWGTSSSVLMGEQGDGRVLPAGDNDHFLLINKETLQMMGVRLQEVNINIIIIPEL